MYSPIKCHLRRSFGSKVKSSLLDVNISTRSCASFRFITQESSNFVEMLVVARLIGDVRPTFRSKVKVTCATEPYYLRTG